MKNKFFITKKMTITTDEAPVEVKQEGIEEEYLEELDSDDDDFPRKVTLVMEVYENELLAYQNAVSNQNKINRIYDDVFRKIVRYDSLKLYNNHKLRYAQTRMIDILYKEIQEHFTGEDYDDSIHHYKYDVLEKELEETPEDENWDDENGRYKNEVK